MSQHTYPSDIVQTMDAMITLNSGDTEPPSTRPFMLWMDTSADPAILKQRNADDTGWEILLVANGSFVPVGTINAIGGTSVPAGWLECDGTAVSRSEYASLFAQLGTTCGAGDGSTTFNLPDLRGEFIRGWDNGRGVDAGRSVGAPQVQATSSEGLELFCWWYNGYSEHSCGFNYLDADVCVTGQHRDSRYIEKNKAGTQLIKGTADETRPRNIALMYIIKY